jgi:hypothetical protein
MNADSWLGCFVYGCSRGWEYVRCRAEALLPCRFSILVLAVVALAFVASDQGIETLRVVAEFTRDDTRSLDQVGLPYPFRVAIFFLSATAFAAQLWYCSRIALSFEVATAPPAPEVRPLIEWTPRVLGALGFLAPAAGLVIGGAFLEGSPTAGVQLLLAGGLAVLAAVFLFLVVHRRRWFGLEGRAEAFDRRIRSFRELPTSARWVLLGTTLFAVVLFYVVIREPVHFSQWIGAASVLLLCATIWVLAGAFLLYLAGSWRLPVVTFLVLFAILASRYTDNHVVNPLPGTRPVDRFTLTDALLDRRAALDAGYGSGDHTIFVVAAEGGGIRAAYWTAAVLAAIQDANPAFSSHCFAISSVSGGSLGSAVFTTLLRSDLRNLRDCSHEVLSADFLSPTLARMFGTDLPKQFLPKVPLPDRGRGLEMAWEDAWRHEKPNAFGEPFLEAEGDPSRPLLFLNGTWAETGRRVIFSPVLIGDEFENAADGFDHLGGDLPVSTAVHMSARFTYVSPAATIAAKPRRDSMHVVDGGYFENSGAATASDVVKAIEASGVGRMIPEVVVIRYSEAADDVGASSRIVRRHHHGLSDERFRDFLSEALSPIRAMLGARVSRGEFAIEELKKRSTDHWIEFVLTPEEDVPLPLGWSLSAAARDSIDLAMRRRNVQRSLAQVRERLERNLPAADRSPETAPDSVAAKAEMSSTARKTDLIRQAFRGR